MNERATMIQGNAYVLGINGGEVAERTEEQSHRAPARDEAQKEVAALRCPL